MGIPRWAIRELAGADRAIIFLIFLEQCFISVSLLWGASMADPYASSSRSYAAWVFYALWGLISACGLFFTGLLPRVFALLWHVVFVGYAVMASANDIQAARASDARRWAVYDGLALFYLAITAFIRYRDRSKELNSMTQPRNRPSHGSQS